MDPIPTAIPVLPIRNAVLFPSISMPLVVGRERSIRALERAESGAGLLIIVAQKVLTPGDPEATDLFQIGTLCKLENIVQADAGSRQAVVTGLSRFRISEYQLEPDGFLSGRGEIVPDVSGPDTIRNEALFHHLKELSREILQLLPGTTEHLVELIDRVDDPSYMTHVCAAYLNLALDQRQEILETPRLDLRMELILVHMRKERDVLDVQRDIRDKMAERLSKAQREALLREQIRTIRTELGEESGEETTVEIEERLLHAKLPEEASKQAQEELGRMRSLPANSAEYHVVRTYLELLAALPWEKRTTSVIDVERARLILDEDHYGLEAVKRRILQFLAVAKLKNDLHGPILCLVGPPGVGKTSLGQSVARALGRKFTRTSLGGVRDEAEIRGHRRTYVGAMPGRIIQSIKRAGTKNPVMMLDEIDKLRADFHGDPSAAMLEVLDPEQNRTFTDHYLDLPFDLSEVFFVCTANVVDGIPTALLDRMEIIEVNGYTGIEKLQIARRYLIPKLLNEHGLKPEWIELPDETVERVINHHTHEAGVREVQRKVAAIFRGVAEKVVAHQRVNGPEAPFPVLHLGPESLKGLIGPDRFFPEAADKQQLKTGVAMGLAWTPHGGDLLFIEATAMGGGKGSLLLTGHLGEVMKESAQIALSMARTLVPFEFHRRDIHIHVPAGAIPKDGPSAGVTLFAALASLLLAKPLRPGTAMTGELTLRGAVLPVGGVKEKVLAAHRAGVRTVILPERNRQDLDDVLPEVRSQLRFVFVNTAEDLIEACFEPAPVTRMPGFPNLPRAG